MPGQPLGGPALDGCSCGPGISWCSLRAHVARWPCWLTLLGLRNGFRFLFCFRVLTHQMHSCLRLGKSPTYPWDSPSGVPGPAVAVAQKPCREASAQAPGGRESGMGVVPPHSGSSQVVWCLRTTNAAPLPELTAAGWTGGSRGACGGRRPRSRPPKRVLPGVVRLLGDRPPAALGTSSQLIKKTRVASTCRALFSGKCIKA